MVNWSCASYGQWTHCRSISHRGYGAGAADTEVTGRDRQPQRSRDRNLTHKGHRAGVSTTEAMVCLAALASLRPEPTVMVELEAAASSTLKGGKMVKEGREVVRLGIEEER